MKLRSNLPRLQSLKTAADYEKAVREIGAAISETEVKLAELNGRLPTAFFDSPEAELEKIRSEIGTLKDDVETLRAAQSEAGRRREEMAHAERMAEIEAELKEAQGYAEALLAEYVELDVLLAKAAERLEKAERLGKKIKEANGVARNAGRNDLMVDHPVVRLARHLDTQILDPIHAYQPLPHYRPPHPDGSPYSHFKELKVKHG